MADRFQIEWSPVAQQDLDEILEYVAGRDCVDAALAVYESLIPKIDRLASHPARCRNPPELRQIGITEYHELVAEPYGVFFRIDGCKVGIVGVLDRRRDVEELLLQRVIRA